MLFASLMLNNAIVNKESVVTASFNKFQCLLRVLHGLEILMWWHGIFFCSLSLKASESCRLLRQKAQVQFPASTSKTHPKIIWHQLQETRPLLVAWTTREAEAGGSAYRASSTTARAVGEKKQEKRNFLELERWLATACNYFLGFQWPPKTLHSGAHVCTEEHSSTWLKVHFTNGSGRLQHSNISQRSQGSMS